MRRKNFWILATAILMVLASSAFAASISTTFTVRIHAGALSVANGTLTLSSTPVSAGTVITATAKAVDGTAFHNGISGLTSVTFTSSNGGDVVSAVTDLGGGFYSVTILATAAGVRTISVNIATQTQNLTVTPAAMNTANGTLVLSSASVSQGTVVTATATAADTYANAISGLTGVTFTSSNGGDVISAVTDLGGGAYSVTIVATVAGVRTISVNTATQTRNLTITAGPFVLANGSLTLSSTPVSAGTVVTATGRALDAVGNPVSGLSGVTFTSSNGADVIGAVTDTGNGYYEATVLGTAAAVRTISVNIATQTQNLTVQPNVPAVALVLPNPSDVIAESTVDIDAAVADTYANPITLGQAYLWGTATAGWTIDASIGTIAPVDANTARITAVSGITVPENSGQLTINF